MRKLILEHIVACGAALLAIAAVGGCASVDNSNTNKNSSAGASLPSVNLAGYMGEWQQVAHIPNRFQRQCVSGAKASYRLLDTGQVEVRNQCRTASGLDSVTGVARPRAGATIESGELRPGSLEVAFAPSWLRWTPFVWADYDIVYLSPDRSLAVVTEPSRTYMWVLSRTSEIDEMGWRGIERHLLDLGFVRDQWVKDRS
ncbi:lipocalin family protein [Variovorax sp. GT1P44]|uniref:lipocalin family protein n=1 Tax=Variovorax sp. GT1P44 TaxID=3443742 RepID=UPI003F4667E8